MSDMSSEREAHVRELFKKAAAGDGLVKRMNSVYSFLREAGLRHGSLPSDRLPFQKQRWSRRQLRPSFSILKVV